jgi:PAS domain S-box-containing protein
VIPDLRESPYAQDGWANCGYRTFVSAPLLHGGMLLGCVNLGAREVIRFDPDQENALKVLLTPISLFIANSELVGSAQRKIQYLSALHQCSQDLGPAPDLEHVTALTAERMAQLLGLARVLVLLRDEGLDEFVGAAGHGLPPEAVYTVRVPGGPAVAELTEQGALVSSDAAAEGWLPEEFVREQKLGTVLIVPLHAHDRVIGVLIGEHSRPLHLTPSELELAMIFANQASVWIAGARLLVREQAARTSAEATRTEFQALLDLAPDAIITVGRDGVISLVNAQAEKMFGHPRAELIGQPIEVLLPRRYRDAHVGHRSRYHQDPRTRPMGSGLELYALRRDGREFPVEISLGPTRTDGGEAVIAVIRDITERRTAEDERARLLASEQQKGEQLKLAVREAHHRIKNNLQAISDLLYLELSTSAEGPALSILRESVERIQSIALVHDLLSQDEDVQTVDSREMIERLVPMVLRSSGVPVGDSDLRLQVGKFPLSSKKATTLALIVNELVSNAAKHALNGTPGARLQVTLEEAFDGLRLSIEDNGPGLPAGFEISRDANVGLQVVRTLAERDLQGKFSLSTGPNLRAEVWFSW